MKRVSMEATASAKLPMEKKGRIQEEVGCRASWFGGKEVVCS
jgi:hypothetical protein